MRIPLRLLSTFYGFGSFIKNSMYATEILKPKTVPIKVISIGNLTFGGTGKTPATIEVIRFLQKKNKKVCLVIRGYKGRWEKSGGILSNGKEILGTWQESGDEAFLAAQNLPGAGVFVGGNRHASCVKAAQMGFEIAVLDDAFQHRKLYRDVEIVLLNQGRESFFREFSSSLKRADILLMKKNAAFSHPLSSTIKKRASMIPLHRYRIVPQGIYPAGKSKPPTAADFFKDKKILALCGIAKPERFFSLLNELGIEPVRRIIYPDHHPFPNSSIKKIMETARREKFSAIITTEKDVIKIEQTSLPKEHPVYYLRIRMDIEKEFYQLLWSKLENIPDKKP